MNDINNQTIQYQDKSIQYLLKALQRDKLPHALLFTGIEGVGKLIAALQFSMVCNCENLPDVSLIHSSCGECRSCLKFLSGQHPDIIKIKPDGNAVKISQIRMLRKQLTYKPVEAKNRFVIIMQAHLMTTESANALLKILEEPPPRTRFILIVENQKDVLQTISSRCQQVRFRPLSDIFIEAYVMQNEDIKPEFARMIARLSFGSVIRAGLYQKIKWQTKRSYIFFRLKQFDRLSIGMRLSFAEQLAKNKDDIPLILEMIMTWFRDVLIYRFCPQRIINIDYQNSIYENAKKYACQSVIEQIEKVQTVQKDLLSNMNRRLAFEELTMSMIQQKL
ncbi:MAG: DNA polymerase III subunit delta' [Candidatus Magnetomorum sp.]|nr:DNA polymerase III subunit delta' [Candidatus Magnetomorum sp.]